MDSLSEHENEQQANKYDRGLSPRRGQLLVRLFAADSSILAINQANSLAIGGVAHHAETANTHIAAKKTAIAAPNPPV